MRNMRGGSASFLLGAAAPSASIRRPITGRSSFPPTPTAGSAPQRPLFSHKGVGLKITYNHFFLFG